MPPRRRSDGPHGVVVIDKPLGVTSHDVVACVRGALGTRRVGHAGTLDPLASGVLVTMVGVATKLAPYLTADDKRYEAEIQLGVATDTLDGEGRVVATQDLPAWWADESAAAARLGAALAAEGARQTQVPPSYSAIHVDGGRAHARARAGEVFDLPPRAVAVRSLTLLGVDAAAGRLGVAVHVAKGYYVRSLARDLGERLGVAAHLGSLRRTASGVFDLTGAVTLVQEPLVEGAATRRRCRAVPDQVLGALLPTAVAAARALPVAVLTPPGVERARRGQRLTADDFTRLPDAGRPSAWLDEGGDLVAIGELTPTGPALLRGGFDA